MSEPEKEHDLTPKQKKFCEEYIFDFNGTRAAKAAGYSEDTAYSIASENLRKPELKAYIDELQSDLSKTSGISRLKVLREHEKIAFSSIAHLHDTWISRKDFEKLSEDQKASIQEISTQVKTSRNVDGTLEENEYIKIKLYDKQRSLDGISKMLGFNEPDKTDITSKGEKIIFGGIEIVQPIEDSKIPTQAES